MRTPFRCFILAFVLLAGLAVAGCSAHRELATEAVSFNLTVEKAQNEMLLLNILRAKDRLPMYLTGISSLTGNFETTFTGSLSGTYTGTRQQAATSSTSGVTKTLTRAYTPSLSASVTQNPTFTLSVLDTQDFMRGFLNPLGKDTLNYYWTQGWPRELLVYLLVQRVEISDGSKTETLRNYPDSADPSLTELQAFSRWAHEFLAQDPQIEEASITVNIGPEIPEAQLTNLSGLVDMAKQGLVLTRSSDGLYQLQQKQTDLRFKLGTGKTAPETAETTKRSQMLAQKREKMDVTEDSSAKTVTIGLRSPEGLLYYLGELARLANRKDAPVVPSVCIQGRLQPLFVARPSGACRSTFVDADAGDERFSIPKPDSENQAAEHCEAGSLQLQAPGCEPGRSMQSLRLLSQVISLQKSASDNPSTALVRVIN